MALQWHYRLKGREKGPVSFQHLAQLVREGDLSEDDLVRREHTADWGRVGDVIGLLRAAAKEPAATEAETAPPPAQPPVPPVQGPTKGKRFPMRIGARTILVGGTVAVVALVIGYWIWHRHAHPLFPNPGGATSVEKRKPRHEVLAAAEAARSRTCSVPGLQSGVPQRVPGLEGFEPQGSFSLTDDLCTIAFGAAAGPKRKNDLWISKRSDVSKPFEAPTPIESCNSPRYEGKPTLSPDGLEMLFVRTENGPQWLRTQRSSRSSDFGQPAPWVLPGLPGEGRQITFMRFLDAQHVVVSVNNGESKPHFSFYLVERSTTGSEFGPPQEISMVGCGAWVCLRPSRLLGYFGTPKGLFVQGRDTLEEGFVPGCLIFDAKVCGPVQDAIWVTPGDDVAFYCSTGPAKQSLQKEQPSIDTTEEGQLLPQRKSFWMIRF